MIHATRFEANPLIHPGLSASIKSNINGPSLIEVPDWIDTRLGRYYLYFAHHQGQFIRMAYSDQIEGPWRIFEPGTLRLDQTIFVSHIASPDIHIDHESKRIVMYYHGCVNKERHGITGQRSGIAVSSDGIEFQDITNAPLGPFYFRVFRYADAFYALGKRIDVDGGAVLLRSESWEGPFVEGQKMLEDARHTAVRINGDRLEIYYSRGGDCPERILRSTLDLNGDWNSWSPEDPVDVLSSEYSYEGGDLPLEPSEFGAVHHQVRQLRDPCIFEKDGSVYLLYSCAGESGIAGARLQP